MQGKDIPTVFKRPRRRSKEDPFQAPAASGTAQFTPIPPKVFIFNPQDLYPNAVPNRAGLLQGPGTIDNNGQGEYYASPAAGSSHHGAGPSFAPSTAEENIVVDEDDEDQNDMDQNIFSDNEDGVPSATQKGKGRATHPPSHQSTPRPSQTAVRLNPVVPFSYLTTS